MASIEIEELPSAAPAAESWLLNGLGDDNPLVLQADEMFARQLDTGFAGEVHGDRPSLGLEHELTVREIGSPGLVIRAPFAGRLFGVLPLREKNWKENIRKDLPNPLPAGWQDPLPDNWEETLTRINPDYLKWTKAAAEKNGIDPLLLARLFYKESTYDKNLGSAKGAKGIAQLTEIAISELKLDPKTFSYYDPKASIDAGAALLGRYYRYFKDCPKAVAAYNRGITAMYNFFVLTEEGKKNDQKTGLNLETSILLRYVFRGQPEAFDKSK